MNIGLAFHDSEVSAAEAHGDTLSVRFSAAQLSSLASDAPSTPGARYVQGLDMVLSHATWSAPLDDCVGTLSGGRIWVNGATLWPASLPLMRSGVVSAEFIFGNGTVLMVAASAITVRFSGEPRFVESWAC